MFLLGSYLYDMHHTREPSVRAPIVAVVIAVVASVGGILYLTGRLMVPYNLGNSQWARPGHRYAERAGASFEEQGR